MTTLYPALGRVVDEVVGRMYPTLVDEDDAALMEQAYIDQTAIAKRAQELVDELGKLAMGSGTSRYLKTALAIQHRTILGQIAKATAEAVVGTTDPDSHCFLKKPNHPEHDGRLTCDTVVAAEMMAYQPLI
jgi:hypothetical protein